MTNGMIGADPIQLRDLAKTISMSGRQLDAVANSLQATLTKARWRGPDSDHFKQKWGAQLRPALAAAGSGLEDAARQLTAQAAEQEVASADTGPYAGSPGQNGTVQDSPERSWDDVWTDPNYQHAPGGIEFVWDMLMEGGGTAQEISNCLKFVADKFASTLGFGMTADDVTGFTKGVMKLTKGLAWLGIGMGALDIISGIVNQDAFRIADGSVAALLGAATLITAPLALTGVGAAVPIAIGIVGLVWGFASVISGDVPVSKRIWDGVASVGSWVGGLFGGK